MTDKIINFADYKKHGSEPQSDNTPDSMWYEIAVEHRHDGKIQCWVRGADPNDRENAPSIAAALYQAAWSFDPMPIPQDGVTQTQMNQRILYLQKHVKRICRSIDDLGHAKTMQTVKLQAPLLAQELRNFFLSVDQQ